MKPVTDIAIVPREPRWPVRLEPAGPPTLRKVARTNPPSSTTTEPITDMEPITDIRTDIVDAALAAGTPTGAIELPDFTDTDMEAHPIADAAPAVEDIKAKPTTSWRDLIKVHPAADAFPMLSEEELDALAEDIKANGLQLTHSSTSQSRATAAQSAYGLNATGCREFVAGRYPLSRSSRTGLLMTFGPGLTSSLPCL
jgi:hypothetical protein